MSTADEIKVPDHVVELDDGYAFVCPGVTGDECAPFATRGWPTAELAAARAQQHIDEHLTSKEDRANGIGLTPSLAEFRAANGVTQTEDGRAVLADDSEGKA